MVLSARCFSKRAVRNVAQRAGPAGRTAASVQAYLASLPADSQRAIMNGCDHYMLYPTAVQSPDTLPFCRVAVGVSVPTASARTKIVEFGAAELRSPR